MASQVAVIGAGPCGLAQLARLQMLAEGGLRYPRSFGFGAAERLGWIVELHLAHRGSNEHGDPVHGSMYRLPVVHGPRSASSSRLHLR